MCGFVLGFHSVIMQHPDVLKMLHWRKRHIKTDISNRVKPCLVVARDELDQMFPNLPQAVLPAEFSIMVRSEPRLMSFWQGGVLMEKISTWAFARGSGNTFRNCQCHDLLESLYFWTLSPVKLPSAADCFPSALPQSLIMPMHRTLVLDIFCTWYLLEASFIYPSRWIWNFMARHIPCWWQNSEYEITWLRGLANEVVSTFFPSGVLTVVWYQVDWTS